MAIKKNVKPEEVEVVEAVPEETKTVKEVEVKKPEEKPKAPKAKKYLTTTLVNFRIKPSGNVIRALNANTEVEVESIKDGWAKATFEGKVGYIMEKYIKLK